MNNGLLATGVIGTFVSLICCVTPFLPWMLSAIGLSGIIGYVYRDDVLLSLAAFFLVLTGVALWRRRPMK